MAIPIGEYCFATDGNKANQTDSSSVACAMSVPENTSHIVYLDTNSATEDNELFYTFSDMQTILGQRPQDYIFPVRDEDNFINFRFPNVVKDRSVNHPRIINTPLIEGSSELASAIDLSWDMNVSVNGASLLFGVFLPTAYFGPRHKDTNYVFSSSSDVEHDLDSRPYGILQSTGLTLHTSGYRELMISRYLEYAKKRGNKNILYRVQPKTDHWSLMFRQSDNNEQRLTIFNKYKQYLTKKLEEQNESAVYLSDLVNLRDPTLANFEKLEELASRLSLSSSVPYFFLTPDPSWAHFVTTNNKHMIYAYQVDYSQFSHTFRKRIYIGVDSKEDTRGGLGSFEFVFPRSSKSDFDELIKGFTFMGTVKRDLVKFTVDRSKSYPEDSIGLDGWFEDIPFADFQMFLDN